MIWGYPYFRKPPYIYIYIYITCRRFDSPNQDTLAIVTKAQMANGIRRVGYTRNSVDIITTQSASQLYLKATFARKSMSESKVSTDDDEEEELYVCRFWANDESFVSCWIHLCCLLSASTGWTLARRCSAQSVLGPFFFSRRKSFNILHPYIDGNARILKWRYCTLLYHTRPYFGGISPYIGLKNMVGSSNQSVPVAWPLMKDPLICHQLGGASSTCPVKNCPCDGISHHNSWIHVGYPIKILPGSEGISHPMPGILMNFVDASTSLHWFRRNMCRT